MKKNTLLLFVLLSLININICLGQSIVINEVQSSNTIVIADENGNHEDWIELYNNGLTAVNLSGYGLSDNPLTPFEWVFPNILLGPKQYLLIWASDKNKAIPGSPLHTNFKLNASGETISLTNSSGILLDRVVVKAMISNISYGRTPNGTGNFAFFGECTPNAANSTIGYSEFLDPPAFSVNSGFFTQGFNLSLTSTPGTSILYTLDGSEPDPTNLKGTTYYYKNQYPENPGQATGPLLQKKFETLQYSAPISIVDKSPLPNKLAPISSTYHFNPYYIPTNPIFKGTVVKAIAVKTGALSSKSIAKTYIISPAGSSRFSLPVVSLSLNESDLFDYYNGIFVAGIDFDNWRKANPNDIINYNEKANYTRMGIETEKKANLTYLVNGIEKLNQNVGIRIHGESTRSFQSKSFTVYARSEYGNDSMDYKLFNDVPYSNGFKRLILRNSGGDFTNTMFRDALCQELCKSLHCETEAYRPTITFVNGEYWGILDLRENYDDKYFSQKYNFGSNDLDFLENYVGILSGDDIDYLKLFDYFQKNSITSETSYNYVKTRMDLESFSDYYIANIFLANADWPGTNIQFWRKRTDSYIPNAPYGHDGRWRWAFHDMDDTFSLVNDDIGYKSLEFATAANGPDYPNPAWSTLFLRKLLENNSFKNDFINRFADLMNTYFLPSRIISTMNTLKSEIAPEMGEHISRWKEPKDLDEWNKFIAQELEFTNLRPDIQREHIRTKFNIASNINVSLNVSDSNQGYIKMNTIDIIPTTPGIATKPYPWTGIYFKNIPVKIKAVPLPGYAFSNWSGDSNSTSAEITMPSSANMSLTAHFVPAASVGAQEIIYFWMLDTKIADNAPLTSINSTFGITSKATLEFQSCLMGYPFTSTSSSWRKASMERRNSPTTLNYIQEANGNLPFINSNMRGIQIKQPFQKSGAQNTLILNIPTTGHKKIKLNFAVMNEGAATGLTLEYSTKQGIPVWNTSGMTSSSIELTNSYQRIESDFTNISGADNNPDFKIRIRFTGSNMTVDTGAQVTFNNISIQGVPLTLDIDENIVSNYTLYPIPATEMIYISTQFDTVNYKIIGIDGKIIREGNLENGTINLSDLNTGLYLLQLNADGKMEVKKFIKN